MTRNIDIVACPALYQYHRKGGTVVLIDVLRFTSTLTTALANGALWAETYADADKALTLKDEGYITIGEHHGFIIEGFHYNNSPVSMTPENIGGRKLAFVTTNGTYTRSLIDTYDAVYAGCFLNGNALVNRLLEEQNDVQIVCAGHREKIGTDDLLVAGMIADRLLKSGKYTYDEDAVSMAQTLYNVAKDDLKPFLINQVPWFEPLFEENPHYKEDFDFALRHDVYNIVPEEESPYKFVLKQ